MLRSIDVTALKVNTSCDMKRAPSLSTELRHRLQAVADPARAPAMQAYMKSAMPYLGAQAPVVRQVCKALFAGMIHADSAAWQADVLDIWRNAAFREEYYAAIELAGLRSARRFQTMEALAMYREMIISGAWWDTTDSIAPNQLFPILEADRTAMSRTLRDWAVDENIWIRRSAILCQMKAKAKMDIALLEDCIAPSLDSKEFFVRKAIGWVLRQYARTNPDYVRAYVARHADRLSSLTKREALKHLV